MTTTVTTMGKPDNDTLAKFVVAMDKMMLWAMETSRSKGWPDVTPAERIALVHSELSEALEALRHGDPRDAQCTRFRNVEIELADAVIRIMDMCAISGWHLPSAIVAKMEYNETRPETHGGKKF